MAGPHIGTLREKPLHASLKRWYARNGEAVEVSMGGGFAVDVVRGDLLIEVQTRGFATLRPKVETLLEHGYRVRIAYPVAVDTHIVKLGADGTIVGSRRSPRHGSPTDVFTELVSLAHLLGHPCLEIEVVLTEEEECRRHVSGRAWRRHGWVVVERRLVDVAGTLLIRDRSDLAALLPSGLPTRFTTADLAEQLARPRRLAQQMAYCLCHAQVIVAVGRRGHAIEYRTR